MKAECIIKRRDILGGLREKGRIEGARDKENAGVECNDVLGKDEERRRRGARRTEWKNEKDRERKRAAYCATRGKLSGADCEK